MIGYSKHFNTIVIGVGGMGSATCYYLAKRGKRVLGLERFDIPHDLGSSHGYTRIIRLAYYEHPSYVMLLKRSYDLWDEIEARTGQQLLYKNGSIDAGPADSWVFKGALRSAVEHELEHDVLTGAEVNARWPGYQLPHYTMALFQPDGGFLVPERATVAFAEAAHSFGAEIHGRETVLGWEPVGDGVRVFTDRAEYTADSLVITAGAWNNTVLPFLRDLAVPERQVLAWLQPERPELFRPENFPVFNLLVPEGRYYGFPVFAVPGFKFGMYHHFQEHGAPETLDFEPRWEDEEALREFAARYFPQGAGPTMTLKACMFTNSPDKHFIIDLHPQYPQVSFAAGFSGHGYKFASVIGEIMADLAERQETRHDIRLFNVARFTGQVSKLWEDYPGRHTLTRAGRRGMTGTHLPAGEHSTPRKGRVSSRQFSSTRQGKPGHPHGPAPRYSGQLATRATPQRHPLSVPRGRPLSQSQQGYGHFNDSTDPLYWERDSVETFW